MPRIDESIERHHHAWNKRDKNHESRRTSRIDRPLDGVGESSREACEIDGERALEIDWNA